MKIPERLSIGGHVVTVQHSSLCDHDNANGMTCPDQNVILLSRDQPHSTKCMAFIHEIVEIINSKYELGLKHQTISILGEALFQAFNTFQGEIKK